MILKVRPLSRKKNKILSKRGFIIIIMNTNDEDAKADRFINTIASNATYVPGSGWQRRPKNDSGYKDDGEQLCYSTITNPTGTHSYGSAPQSLKAWRMMYPNSRVELNVPFVDPRYGYTTVLTVDCKHPDGPAPKEEMDALYADQRKLLKETIDNLYKTDPKFAESMCNVMEELCKEKGL